MVLLCHLRDPLTVYGLAFAQGGIEQAQKHFQMVLEITGTSTTASRRARLATTQKVVSRLAG